jgi:hypothetical protein
MCNRKICLDFDYGWIIKKKSDYDNDYDCVIDCKSIAFSIKLKNLE